MEKIEQIERYLNNGWGTTPVAAPEMGNSNSGKRPILPEWQKNPVLTMDKAKELWENSDLNVGIVTGEVSRLIVIDVDNPEAFEVFLNKHPECKETYIVKRSNSEGKCHYYFNIPKGMEIPKSRTIKTTGWGDLLSTGKQVVAPPSVHYTGGVYEVVNDVAPVNFKPEYLEDLFISKPEEELPEQIEQRITEGAVEGQRNSILFNLCREMRDLKLGKQKTRDAALRFCKNCTPEYNIDEAIKTVESVFNNNIPKVDSRTLKTLNYYRKKEEDDEGETKYKIYPLAFDRVRDGLLNLTEDWLAKSDEDIFIIPNEKGGKIEYIKDKVQFFSALGCEFSDTPDWKTGQKYMTKEEAFVAVHREIKQYSSIETAPHYPEIDGFFYNYPELPEPDYSVLDDLLDFFTPEKEEDRWLITAMFLTAVWGGLPGQRAPFLITSKDGRGVGKSSLAETAASILGQSAIQANATDKSNVIVTRLLSKDALQKRVVLFDNEAGYKRISNAEIASLFTTAHISGHRLYKGEGSRANNLLWMITLNSPSLDSDFASRCIPVSLKRPGYHAQWKSNLSKFIDQNKEIIQATLIDILSQEGCSVTPSIRWGDWACNVLAKVPGIEMEKVQKLIVERQKEFDDEQDELELIVDAIEDFVRENNYSLENDKVFIHNKFMDEIVRNAIGVKWNKTSILKKVRELINRGDIPTLVDKRVGTHGRGFLWTGTKYTSGETKLATIKAEYDTF